MVGLIEFLWRLHCIDFYYTNSLGTPLTALASKAVSEIFAYVSVFVVPKNMRNGLFVRFSLMFQMLVASCRGAYKATVKSWTLAEQWFP